MFGEVAGVFGGVVEIDHKHCKYAGFILLSRHYLFPSVIPQIIFDSES